MNDETDLQVYKLVLLNIHLKNHRILSSLKYQLPQRQVSNQPSLLEKSETDGCGK